MKIVDRLKVSDQRPNPISVNPAQDHPELGDSAKTMPDNIAIREDEDSIDRATPLAIPPLQRDDQVIWSPILSSRGCRQAEQSDK
jgi:hypothetical protein